MKKLAVCLTVVLVLSGGCADDAADEEPTAAPDVTEQPAATDGEAVGAGGDCRDATKAQGQADLEMQDFVFAPRCLQMSTSQGLRIHNEGAATHNFSVEGFEGLEVDVRSGEENNTEATGLEPGTYTFFCKFHRESENMEGELRVKAA